MQTETQIQHPQTRSNRTHTLALAVLILGTLSALLVVVRLPLFHVWHGIPNTPLTTVCFLLAAAASNSGVALRYKWSIVLGLAFSALGDLFLILPNDRFVPGLASFLATHGCYLWALTSDTRLAAHRWPFLLAGAVGPLLLAVIWPGVQASLRVPVVLYTVVLLGMAAQANARALALRNLASTSAAIGASLFVASDAALAIDRFGHHFPWRHQIVLGTYFAAQAGIALSVVLRSVVPRETPG